LSDLYLVGPAGLEQRLRAIRKKRMASRLSRVATLAVWIVGSIALVTVVVAALLSGR